MNEKLKIVLVYVPDLEEMPDSVDLYALACRRDEWEAEQLAISAGE